MLYLIQDARNFYYKYISNNVHTIMYMSNYRLEVQIPNKMKAGIDQTIESGDYSTQSEFVRVAIRKELSVLSGSK